MKTTRRSYPSDVTDEQWEFLLPYLTLMKEDAPRREHPLREVFNAMRYVVRTGVQWRYLPHHFPPWRAMYQQGRRWLHAFIFLQTGVFEVIAHELRIIERILKDRDEDPTAVILDGRTLQSTPESGSRAGYDGGKRKNGSKVHAAVGVQPRSKSDTLGNLLALTITTGNEQERAQVGELAAKVNELTGGRVQ